MAEHQDLEQEQEYLDRAYDGLEAMRSEANQMLESVLDLGRGGTFQSRTERDIVVRTSLARLSQLDIGDQALYFGRIDRLPEPGQAVGDSFHIGRLAVSSPDHEPLVVDWRAPVAEPFYRATGLSPEGLARRRHLAVRGRRVVGLEDEVFAEPDGDPGPGGHLETATAYGATASGPDGAEEGERLLQGELVLGGPGALLAALGQVRTGHMGDIVGTIQREQDEIIRSPLAGVLLVQGGPGTGKTAVALHRAAYLLYTHRFPLERQGVLVVGPNPLFLRYIEQVLPSLGETGVTLSTVSGLVPDVRVQGEDRPEVARLKGDARMVQVIARAVRTRQRPLRRDVAVSFGSLVLRFSAAESADVVALARRRAGTHNARRRLVEDQVLRRLLAQYIDRRDRAAAALEDAADALMADGDATDALTADGDATDAQTAAGDATDAQTAAGAPTDESAPVGDPALGGAEGTELDPVELRRRLRRVPELAEALDRMWPRLGPQELLHDLFGAPALLRAAGRGILTDAEIASLHRPRRPSPADVEFTDADVALIDEARTLLGPRRPTVTRSRARQGEQARAPLDDPGFWPAGLSRSPSPTRGAPPADVDEIRAYGHIVVDEVQDLSPLQLRMLERRSISGSMTVVGDLAQATGPWVPRRWTDVTEHLTPRRPPHMVELSVSYRTPAEVVRVAARVLERATPEIAPPTPVRASGFRPEVWRVSRAELAAEVAAVAERELAAVAPGRTAVLAPSPLLPELSRELTARGLEPVDPRTPGGPGLTAPLVLLPADAANGLEFDAVVVVEPAEVVREGRAPLGAEDGPSPATVRGLRTLYVALTRPTRRLTVVHSHDLPVDLGLSSPVGAS